LPFLYLCVIVQAQGALRDLRYFFLTNNLRFVKTFLQMRIGAVLVKICKIRKSSDLSNIPHILSIFASINSNFHDFRVMVQAQYLRYLKSEIVRFELYILYFAHFTPIYCIFNDFRVMVQARHLRYFFSIHKNITIKYV